MKTTLGLYHPKRIRDLRIRHLSILTQGMLAVAFILLTGAAADRAIASGPESNTASAVQGQGKYVDEAEEKAYREAKKEPDPRKRAEQLFAFYQKYPNSLLMESGDFKIIKPLEEEYAAYYAATQEPDLEKRGTLLIGFLQKYPESNLKVYIVQEYAKMLKEASQAKKYEQLESLSEKWLKVDPNSRETYAFLAEAASKLQKIERYAQSLEAIYALDPSPNLAKEIFASYLKTQNQGKQNEWREKLFKMPEFISDYMLRYDYVMQFFSEKNYAKAAEYAQLTLKAADLIEKPGAQAAAQLQKVRRASYHVIATNLMENGNFEEAIAALKKAIEAEQYDEGYYKIGQCLENLKQIEEAMLYYARTALMGGDYAERAKARLELLYKALHNDTLIGIDKVYNKAKESDGK